MKKNKLEYLIWTIFATIGIIFVLIGAFLFTNVFNYKNKIETIGTITKITYGDDNKEVIVSYNANGKNYESTLNGYLSSFYEGKDINIYYDKENPNKIGMKQLDLLFLIFPGIGLVFLIIGSTGIIIKINKKKQEQKLKETGKIVYGNYTETIINKTYNINGRNPYNIICEWQDPIDNKKYIFKSKNIWINPEKIIEEKNIKQFPIYINENNKAKYYIDTDKITEDIVDLR